MKALYLLIGLVCAQTTLPTAQASDGAITDNDPGLETTAKLR